MAGPKRKRVPAAYKSPPAAWHARIMHASSTQAAAKQTDTSRPRNADLEPPPSRVLFVSLGARGGVLEGPVPNRTHHLRSRRPSRPRDLLDAHAPRLGLPPGRLESNTCMPVTEVHVTVCDVYTHGNDTDCIRATDNTCRNNRRNGTRASPTNNNPKVVGTMSPPPEPAATRFREIIDTCFAAAGAAGCPSGPRNSYCSNTTFD
jgi:hypothetical protein